MCIYLILVEWSILDVETKVPGNLRPNFFSNLLIGCPNRKSCSDSSPIGFGSETASLRREKYILFSPFELPLPRNVNSEAGNKKKKPFGRVLGLPDAFADLQSD